MEQKTIISINDEKIIEELTCPICLCIFDNPVLELPNQHIFCHKCLDSYLKEKNIENNPICPLCKSPITSMIENPKFINNILETVKMKCSASTPDKECDFVGNSIEYYEHIKKCEIIKEVTEKKIAEIVQKMKEILDKEINPHLKKEHKEIYENYVKDWDWLVDKDEDWKWWWWSNNEWWENKPCIECNILWHKYEFAIQVYESQRISLLKSIK